MLSIVAKDKPRWYQLRWKASCLLVKLARKIYPPNPDVKAFYLQMMHDQMILGGSIVRVDPLEVK